MPTAVKFRAASLALWVLVTLAGCVLLAQMRLATLREAFETDARISHRLLSQRAVQHDAVLATLALMQPARHVAGEDLPEQRLPSVYPQIVGVLRRDVGAEWPQAALAQAEALSRSSRKAVLASMAFTDQAGRFQVVLAAEPTSFALAIDLRSMVPWNEWSMPADSPVRVTVEHQGQQFVVQPGRIGSGGWTYSFHKHLASDSQPFDVHAVRQVGWGELPWVEMLLWGAVVAATLVAWQAWQRQRSARLRAEELLRLGQVARLNTLGELAAGMAHELNQPLTALLANTQAAKRLLDDGPDEYPTARHAMEQAVAQARRATEVLGRLRATVEKPGASAGSEAVSLEHTVRKALDLLEPECRKRSLQPQVVAHAPVQVQADRVALEQIVHNLLTNALQALDGVPAAERSLVLDIRTDAGQGLLRVSDSGPGIAPEALPRLFEPFFTTREGGMGLGLSLCETLATGMGGSLQAQANAPRGAVFVLALPLAAQGEGA